MAKTSELARKIAALDADIAKLQEIRAYLAADAPEAATKRERKPKKKAARAEEGI